MEERAGGGFDGEGTGESSNGSDLSSPPPDHSPPRSHGPYNGAGENVNVVYGASKNTSAPASAPPAAPPTKKTRKKKEAPAADGDGKPKEKKTRKPREPKDPNAPPKKRVKKTHDDSASKPAMPQQSSSASASRQSKITDIVGSMHSPTPQHASRPPVEANQVLPSNAPTPSTPRPISSGQVFDPIRSATLETGQHAGSVPPVSPSMRLVNRASASPSITSLIDPVPQRAPSAQQHHHRAPAFAAPPSVTSAPVSPSATSVKPSHANVAQPTPTPYDAPWEMEIDRPMPLPPKQEPQSAGPSSTAPTPPTKPARQKEAPPPLPTGSGLLSGTPLGGIAPATNGTNGTNGTQATNIFLHFDLKGKTNIQINFAREVEKKYGFAALHPRLAARNERRRMMAAAGAALENAAGNGSADDMSLDISEPESDVAMGGAGEEASTGSGGKRKRKPRKAEEYDRNDEFIDDTELAWEQQALMAKDGFFVYSGPLVGEGEKPSIERADGTVPKRGRGRGRGSSTRGETSGRGSRGGGRGSRGGGEGRGSRGGTTVRKPRVTKADRMMMEQEKLEREKMAATLAAKPQMSGSPAMPTSVPQPQQVTFHQ